MRLGLQEVIIPVKNADSGDFGIFELQAQRPIALFGGQIIIKGLVIKCGKATFFEPGEEGQEHHLSEIRPGDIMDSLSELGERVFWVEVSGHIIHIGPQNFDAVVLDDGTLEPLIPQLIADRIVLDIHPHGVTEDEEEDEEAEDDDEDEEGPPPVSRVDEIRTALTEAQGTVREIEEAVDAAATGNPETEEPE